MKSLKNYEKNYFEIFDKKNKFKQHKQKYVKNKKLYKDLFIDISDIRDDEISLNKNYKNLCKEEKFITIEENISIEEDDLIETCKEEDESENKNNMFMLLSIDKYTNDSSNFKENEDPNTVYLNDEKDNKINVKESKNKKIIYFNTQEDKDMSIESSSENESDLERENKYYLLRKEIITRINNLNNEEIIDLMVFIENIRPQAIEELSNDAMYINIEQFNDDTFIKVFDYLTNVNII